MTRDKKHDDENLKKENELSEERDGKKTTNEAAFDTDSAEQD